MEKVTKYLPYCILIALFTKIMIIPASIPDAFIFLCTVCYVVLEQLRLKDHKIASYDAVIKE